MVNVNLNQMQPSASASASASASTSSMTKNKRNETKTRSRLFNRSTIIGIIFLLIICDIIFDSNINTNTNTNTNSKATSTSTTSIVDRGREDSTTTTTTTSSTTTTTSPKTVLQQVRFVFIVSIRDRSSSHTVLEELGIGSPIHHQLLNLKLPPPVLSLSSSSSSSSLIQKKKNQNQNPQEFESKSKSLYRIINQSFQFLFSIGSSSRLNLKKGKKGKKGKKPKLKDNNLWKLYEDSYQELIIGLKTFSDSYSSSRSQHQLVSLKNEKENNNNNKDESESSSSSSSSSFIDIPLNVFIPTRSPRTATSSSTSSTNTSTSLLLTSQSYMESNDYHLSYPFGLNVRQWNEYPNLDLYYNVCTAANVSCGHIYLHNSNTNSKSNPYTSSSHSSHNTGYNSQQNGIEDVVSQFLKSSSAEVDEEEQESAHSQNYKYDHFSKQQQTQQHDHDHDRDDDQLLYYNYKFYHGYYQIIEMQLQKHSLRLIDCLDISTIMNMKMLSDNKNTNKKMNTDKNMNMLWIKTVRNLFGFDTTKNLMNHLENYFFNSNSNNKNNNNNNNDSTTPKPTSVTNFFSDIVEETYLRTLRTCPQQQQLLQQKGHRSPPPPDNANDANDSSSSSNDNTNGNTTTDEIIIQNEEFNSPLKYFFVIGIEGTGHHFLTGLFSGAPFAIQNSHSNISTQVVVESKYIHQKLKKKAMSLAQLDSAINSFQYNQIFHSFVGLFQRENEIVKKDLLRIQQQQQQQQPIQQQQQQLQYRTMPLNCNMNRMGMASYPVGFDTNIAAKKKYNNPNLNKNKLGEVRSMVYPTIDLIYKACNEAKVDCGHLYLYRPPDQVLQSTISNRHYHNSILEAIQLYTTFLQRIESDLRNYSHRNWGCIGLYDDDLVDALSAFDNKDIYSNSSSTSQSTTATNYPLWFNITPALLGFDNPTEWARYMKSKLKPTTSTESTQKQRKGGKFQQKLNDEYQHLQIYKIFVEQHHRTIQACKENIVPIA